VHKVLSTPEAPERAILQGIADMGLDPQGLRVVHGSTVATNAVLEGKGVRTAFVTNRGFADLLTIGRQAREGLYDLQPEIPVPPVPPELCLETGGRLAATGEVIEPLSEVDLEVLRAELERLKPESVAVNLLFSYLDATAEQRIADRVPEEIFVSLSSTVLPEIREYERGMATWLNAYVGPLVEGYVRRLEAGLPGAHVSVIQSSGETVAAGQAASQAVRMLLSGPAGGLVGAGFVGELAGHRRLLTFDMGGTSTDVALIDGEPRLTSEGIIGRYPVGVPMVDMHTIGAGGGSIAYLDAGGMLQVGPESAGADPGPACYGRGGSVPTVTDANLVLGRLRADAFLGGRMALDAVAARRAVGRLADVMGVTPEEAAAGIVIVANEHMAQALRAISVQRGEDAREYTLVSFGGAGGLHVCALADALEMRRAMVPIQAGVLSALGMLATRPGRQLSRTFPGILEELGEQAINSAFEALLADGRNALAAEGIGSGADTGALTETLSLDLRYRGQSYTLNVPWSSPSAAHRDFEQRHEALYGHRLPMAVELVNLRAALLAPSVKPSLQILAERRPGEPSAQIRVAGVEEAVQVFERENLAPGQVLRGPAIITETVSTTWLAPGWGCEIDELGNLIIMRV
ncbi:MAG: hydantoinase/oxoprolinase family protein, partial [Pseudomonadota bacterium]